MKDDKGIELAVFSSILLLVLAFFISGKAREMAAAKKSKRAHSLLHAAREIQDLTVISFSKKPDITKSLSEHIENLADAIVFLEDHPAPACLDRYRIIESIDGVAIQCPGADCRFDTKDDTSIMLFEYSPQSLELGIPELNLGSVSPHP